MPRPARLKCSGTDEKYIQEMGHFAMFSHPPVIGDRPSITCDYRKFKNAGMLCHLNWSAGCACRRRQNLNTAAFSSPPPAYGKPGETTITPDPQGLGLLNVRDDLCPLRAVER